jgi:hypothetical protein
MFFRLRNRRGDAGGHEREAPRRPFGADAHVSRDHSLYDGWTERKALFPI